jgi:hypothetical protein
MIRKIGPRKVLLSKLKMPNLGKHKIKIEKFAVDN